MKLKDGEMQCPHCKKKIDYVTVLSTVMQSASLVHNVGERPFYQDCGDTDFCSTDNIQCPKCLGELKGIVGDGGPIVDES